MWTYCTILLTTTHWAVINKHVAQIFIHISYICMDICKFFTLPNNFSLACHCFPFSFLGSSIAQNIKTSYHKLITLLSKSRRDYITQKERKAKSRHYLVVLLRLLVDSKCYQIRCLISHFMLIIKHTFNLLPILYLFIYAWN